MSTQNPTHGTKVTDSSAPLINEGAGAIASDSLAADSTREGGEFSENRGSEPLGVEGANSTFANEDTSGAETLDPTADAKSRPDDETYTRGPENSKRDTQAELDAGAGSGGGGGDGSSAVDTAPSYVNSQFVDTAGPKGKNLTEGGFESDDSKNASFNAEIGSKDDPSLKAEEKFMKENSAQVGTTGVEGQGGKLSSEAGTYGALDQETEA